VAESYRSEAVQFALANSRNGAKPAVLQGVDLKPFDPMAFWAAPRQFQYSRDADRTAGVDLNGPLGLLASLLRQTGFA
jgi:hypothetical protein